MADDPHPETWPPPPNSPPSPEPILPKSRAAARLLTGSSALDFRLGLGLGPLVFLLLTNFIGSVFKWNSPPSPRPLPTPQGEYWLAWSAATLGAALLFGLCVRRYPSLMTGFAVTVSVVALVFLLVFTRN